MVASRNLEFFILVREASVLVAHANGVPIRCPRLGVGTASPGPQIAENGGRFAILKEVDAAKSVWPR